MGAFGPPPPRFLGSIRVKQDYIALAVFQGPEVPFLAPLLSPLPPPPAPLPVTSLLFNGLRRRTAGRACLVRLRKSLGLEVEVLE
jgi:hypothetical protein